MTLRELEPGDIFRHQRSTTKSPKKFIVYGNPAFNRGHGSATRLCRTIDGYWIGKSCKLLVVKTGESIHKEKIKAQLTNSQK